MELSQPTSNSPIKSRQMRHDPSIWRPQKQFSTHLRSLDQVRSFNEKGGIAVYLDVTRAAMPDISIKGSQSETFSFWETHSSSGFVTKPKFSAGLLTFRFVTNGHIVYLHGNRETLASRTIAVLTDFDSLYEARAPGAVNAISATIAAETLADAQRSLTGNDLTGLPRLERIADMAMPGMSALFSTIRLLQVRINDVDKTKDLMFPMIQEIIGYQILSSWPKFSSTPLSKSIDCASPQLRTAIDYIDAQISTPMMLSDIAAAAGTSVRSLQNKFKAELGRTPIKYITDRRLAGVHADLQSSSKQLLSIAELARAWGFVYMSDFGKRYRAQYGCTPSETRNG